MNSVGRISASAHWALAVVLVGCTSELTKEARTPGLRSSTTETAAAPSAAEPPAETAVREANGAPAGDCSSVRATGDATDPDAIETIAPEQRVPAFDVTTLDCRNLRSGELVGKRPFVVVFFTSWCKVCERKMPSVRAAITALGNQVDFIGVALDEDETWNDVSPFVERHGLSFPIVRGTHFRNFAFGYDPMGSIPVVVVVGRNGVVVDLQVGYSPFDYNRLVGAASIAQKGGGKAL